MCFCTWNDLLEQESWKMTLYVHFVQKYLPRIIIITIEQWPKASRPRGNSRKKKQWYVYRKKGLRCDILSLSNFFGWKFRFPEIPLFRSHPSLQHEHWPYMICQLAAFTSLLLRTFPKSCKCVRFSFFFSFVLPLVWMKCNFPVASCYFPFSLFISFNFCFVALSACQHECDRRTTEGV